MPEGPTNTHLTLVSLALNGGVAQFGAGVFVEGGGLTATGVSWSNNWATTTSASELPVPAAGGAIFNRSGSVVATNCAFVGSRAFNPGWQDSGNPMWSARGGALCSDGGVSRFDTCVFFENRALGGDATAWQLGFAYGVRAWGGAIYSSGSLWLNRCTFRGNSATGGKGSSNNTFFGPGAPGAEALGGALWSGGEATIERSTFKNNTCSGGDGGASGRKSDPGDPSGDTGGAGGRGGGGALFTQGILVASGCSFMSNSVTGGHGGNGGIGGQWSMVGMGYPGGAGGPSGSAEGSALLCAGSASLLNCTFAANQSVGLTGGAGGTGGKTDRATAPGGRGGPGGNGGHALAAIHDRTGTLRGTNCTIAYNSAVAGAGGPGGGGGGSGPLWGEPYGPSGPDGTNGIAVAGLQTTGGVLINTLLGSNAPGGNIAGTVMDAGHNLSSDPGAVLTNTTSLNGVDPKIGLIGLNGRGTPTVPLLGGSPAISAADPTAAPLIDQRGFHRPLGPAPDIGACEYAFAELISAAVTGDGAFRCELRGEAAETCVIQASPDWLTWLPVQTNVLGATPVPFVDPGATQFPRRWYRAVIVP